MTYEEESDELLHGILKCETQLLAGLKKSQTLWFL